MRSLSLPILCTLALATIVHAGPRRCGDDVDGRGRSVPCDCGDVLVGSRTLGDDDPITTRVCPGTGLMVVVPSHRTARLVLGQRGLVGSGGGFGIQIVGSDPAAVTIVGPGSVRGFDVGVFAPAGQLESITDVTAADNRSDGFRLNGNGYAVTRCEALANGRDGFVLGGVGYKSERNRAIGNRRYGFRAAGRDAAIGGTGGNEASQNGRDGLRVRGRGHDVRGVVATGNGRRGVAARIADGSISDARTRENRDRGLVAAGARLTVSGTETQEERGIHVRGNAVRDGGGNRAASCRIGGPCR
jgi:hypothetical protein